LLGAGPIATHCFRSGWCWSCDRFLLPRPHLLVICGLAWIPPLPSRGPPSPSSQQLLPLLTGSPTTRLVFPAGHPPTSHPPGRCRPSTYKPSSRSPSRSRPPSRSTARPRRPAACLNNSLPLWFTVPAAFGHAGLPLLGLAV
jgi:hypothetical protein